MISLLAVALLSSLAIPATTASAQARATGTQYRIAVILYSFADHRDEPVTAKEVKRRVFLGTGDDHRTGSVNSWFDEVTDGEIQFGGALEPAGDVFGWYQLDRSVIHPTGGQPYACPILSLDAKEKEPLMDDIHAAAAEDGFDPTKYDAVIYASNWETCGSYAQDGRTIFVAAMRPSFWPVISHELGHWLGLSHAWRADCYLYSQPTTWGGRCNRLEYADGQSTMGHHSQLGHFSSYEKLRLGVWELGTDVVDATQPGVYRLAPVTDGPGSTRALRIATDVNPGDGWSTRRIYSSSQAAELFYHLEYRTQTGFNVLTQQIAGDGVSVRVAPSPSSYGAPHFVDGNLDEPTDFRLVPGEWYRDPGSDTAFRVVSGSADASGVSVEVINPPTVSPASLRLDPVTVGVGFGPEPSLDHSTITNTTGVPLRLTAAANVQGPFFWNRIDRTLQPGGSMQVRVDFAPQQPGEFTDEIVVETDTPFGPITIPVSGEGVRSTTLPGEPGPFEPK